MHTQSETYLSERYSARYQSSRKEAPTFIAKTNDLERGEVASDASSKMEMKDKIMSTETTSTETTFTETKKTTTVKL